ncbi:23S rRNA (adenine(2503)-C(2))-methyltransferase RlmN [Vallitalea guaymasensis]|uniref:23S rRNA (adenine(2503)-C(2))-methyltransferase RlmN n=1 Tax=Vallitalea guaymasensis TaxID=1185412 RepID=UPI00272A97C2|nr:23S rRNA (adenine(2503)-C(2))-methyltransferase RlmN [Vallitalea guaymasensis]
MNDKVDILSMSMDELIEFMEKIGEKKFRAKQIYEWLHEKRVSSFTEMTNISKALQDKLAVNCDIVTLREVKKLESKDGTRKYLFELNDHHVVESVFMSYKHGNSVCISSQVGCRMGCKFCASTIGGLKRNLTVSEMLGQVYEINRISGKRISNIVIMGTGEPLDNYDVLIKFIKIINSEEGMNISQRNITVSTCGIIEKINEIADENLKITLAISLHAPNNSIRKTMMPIANAYDYDLLIEACKDYVKKTKRRITFEYSLVKGVNDGIECAKELSKVLKGILCHVNLIPVNQVEERSYRHSSKDTILAFKNVLERHKIPTTIRRELGSDIDAACGQLRRSYTKDKNKEV